ncbi:MAG: hypothetical protein DRJ49_01100 [Thermoprotei archaeon]|nr:MAG: hypothetical protein DRN53_00775 [Thermoprotei archaeon]RLE90012.1 MAG: hypothetical protein DRJ49_01100 [Thermoprotei archaeon]
MHVREGDIILLYRSLKRKFVVKVEKGRDIHTDLGVIRLSNVIGLPYGSRVKTHLGEEFILLKPSILDAVYIGFKRKTQVIYPKDAAYIILTASVSSGSRVVEAGTGSGCLTAILAYLVKPTGRVYSYEVREEFLEVAKENLNSVGLLDYVELKLKDIRKGIDEDQIDAVILDLPDPWNVVEHARKCLRSGGVLVAFLPTINQIERTSIVLRDLGFIDICVVELLLREYRVERDSTRPKTLMVGHTGYIVSARRP